MLNTPILLTTGRMFAHYHTGTMTRVSPALDREQPTGYVEINPEDAGKLEVREGEVLVISSPRGRIEAPAKISLAVLPGNLFLPIHFGENPTNVLTNSEALDPLAKIPEFKVRQGAGGKIGGINHHLEETWQKRPPKR